jgi:A/G-specific adenine glycosylase
VPGLKRIVSKLLQWFSHHGRDLPWRGVTDPYAIWISEVMLQQTQVQTVLPYWRRWMHDLPTIASLAKAPTARVLKLWEGLGYYHRARNLQRAAQVIVQAHGGRFPEASADVLALPGIGRYTAGAICSIAFDQPAPILDGNVMRVLARVYGIEGDPRAKPVNSALWSLAQDLVQKAHAETRWPRPCAHFNQALMELGALICRPKQAQCSLCPLRQDCVARREGRVDRLPGIGKRPAITPLRYAAFVACAKGQVLVRQRAERVVNAGLWEFPNLDITNTPEASPVALASACFGFSVPQVELLCSIQHTITRYRIRLDAYWIEANAKTFKVIPNAGAWLRYPQLDRLAFTSAHRKIIAKARDRLRQ